MSKIEELLDVFVIHYSKLSDRREFLESRVSNLMPVHWITEESVEFIPLKISDAREILGISPRLIGMDLGINSRSLTRSRQKARLEGYQLLLASYIDKRRENLVASQIQNRTRLQRGILENLQQHIHAMGRGATSDKPFILILEDDAVPNVNVWNEIEEYLISSSKKRLFAFVGSGAELTRTSSDKHIDRFGFYSTGTFCSRTAVATLYSRDVLQGAHHLISKYGVPDWMPIDYLLQALARKMRIRTLWQDPPWFAQGSENGLFKSSLR